MPKNVKQENICHFYFTNKNGEKIQTTWNKLSSCIKQNKVSVKVMYVVVWFVLAECSSNADFKSRNGINSPILNPFFWLSEWIHTLKLSIKLEYVNLRTISCNNCYIAMQTYTSIYKNMDAKFKMNCSKLSKFYQNMAITTSKYLNSTFSFK